MNSGFQRRYFAAGCNNDGSTPLMRQTLPRLRKEQHEAQQRLEEALCAQLDLGRGGNVKLKAWERYGMPFSIMRLCLAIAVMLTGCFACHRQEKLGFDHLTTSERAALDQACRDGQTDWVRRELDRGEIDVDARLWGSTLLSYALSHRPPETMVKLLLERGATVDEAMLYVGAAQGNPQILKMLLDHAGAVSTSAVLGRAVFECCSHGSFASETDAVQTIRLLLDRGASFDLKWSGGRTALQVALGKGYIGIAQLLMEHGADANATDEDGTSALMVAAYGGRLEGVRLLLHAGAKLEARDKYRQTPLLVATLGASAYNGLDNGCKVVELLLNQGAAVDAKDVAGTTALMTAAAHCNGEILQLLLRHGANLNARNGAGRTVLSSAGNAATVRLLLSSGAHPTPTDNLRGVVLATSVRAAAEAGDLARVRKLLARGGDANEGEKEAGLADTPLTLGAKNGHTAVVCLLLSRGAKLKESPALFEAVRGGHVSIVKMLLKHGDIRDPRPAPLGDESLLMDAVSSGRLGVVKALLEGGYSANFRLQHISDGQVFYESNPLLVSAVCSGNLPLAKLLLSYGADVNATGMDGRTPLQWAQQNHCMDMVALLTHVAAK